jgi:hypothetical protein
VQGGGGKEVRGVRSGRGRRRKGRRREREVKCAKRGGRRREEGKKRNTDEGTKNGSGSRDGVLRAEGGWVDGRNLFFLIRVGRTSSGNFSPKFLKEIKKNPKMILANIEIDE